MSGCRGHGKLCHGHARNRSARALKAHGAREIFGIPGDFVLPFYKVIEQSGILPHYELSHEPAVGFAADAAARFHGGIGVAVVTYGAGAFNLVNSVAGAYAERSPVVVIAGAPGARERKAAICCIIRPARSTPSSRCSRDHLRPGGADDPATAPAEIARVLRTARELSLPVYIEFPRDMVDAKVEPVKKLPQRGGRSWRAGRMFRGNSRPDRAGEIAGGGGRRRNPPLRRRETGRRHWRENSACRW